MDGVLADFDGGVVDLCHLKPLKQGFSTEEEDERLYAGMREASHFYYKLKPLPDGMSLFRSVYEMYGNRVEILSGIPTPRRGITEAKEDKINWCKEYLPENLVVNISLRKEKILYCRGKQDILIDDFFVNINEWEKAGGTGILYTNAEEALQQLRHLLESQE